MKGIPMVMNLIFPFLVNWEVLRSGFNNTLDVALEADTYGEEWVLEMRSEDSITLKTPRGSTRVIGLKSSSDPSNTAPFDTIVINEQELARLLGIHDDAVAPWGTDVFLAFASDGPEEQRFTFKANPKFFVSVNLKFSL
jgi:hypothetical protein